MRNPHAGQPFTDDDQHVAEALIELSVPTLACALVHATGDLAWLRELPLRRVPSSLDYQGGLTAAEQAAFRSRALPAVLDYRDRGCEPVDLDEPTLREMMDLLATTPVEDRLATMLREDLQFTAGDAREVRWGDEVPDSVRAASPVVVIGAGMSGILAGIRLGQAGLPYTIFDANAGPGGTWWENRYPGARVDVGSHQYCYSFEPSAHWSQYYCQHPELRRYFTDVADRHGVTEHCRFSTRVTSLVWDDDAQGWRVSVVGPDGVPETVAARFVISAVGSLNLAHLPEIEGMDTFAGRSFHSTRWPGDLDLAGVRFALVGAGASGFQIAPSIADQVAHLDIYQRTAQWMLPNPVYRANVSAGERWAMRHLPFYARWFRFIQTYPGMSVPIDSFRFDPAFDGNDLALNATNAARREMLEGWIRSQLEGRDDLIAKSIPDYPPFGKRILQDDGFWLRSLRRDNVELIRTGIERVVPDGIVTVDGVHRRADVICYATGFRHNDFLASLEVIGRGGVDLRDQWGDEPSAYLGVTMPNFPNLFCLYGPGTNLAHSSSLFFHSEFQTTHAMQVIHRTLSAGAAAAEVRPAPYDAYATWHQHEISELVWAHPAIRHSHYKNAQGRVYTLSPWAVDHYWELTHELDPDAYELTGSSR